MSHVEILAGSSQMLCNASNLFHALVAFRHPFNAAKLWQQMNKDLAFKVGWWKKRCHHTNKQCKRGSTSGRMKRVAFRNRFKRKKTFFFNPCEAKRLNGNFLLSGMMQGPYHFLCFTLMCFQRETTKDCFTTCTHTYSTALQPFSRLHCAIDLCCKDTVFWNCWVYCCSHGSLLVCNSKKHFNFKSDSHVQPSSSAIGIVNWYSSVCFALVMWESVCISLSRKKQTQIGKQMHFDHTHLFFTRWTKGREVGSGFVTYFEWPWTLSGAFVRCVIKRF